MLRLLAAPVLGAVLTEEYARCIRCRAVHVTAEEDGELAVPFAAYDSFWLEKVREYWRCPPGTDGTLRGVIAHRALDDDPDGWESQAFEGAMNLAAASRRSDPVAPGLAVFTVAEGRFEQILPANPHAALTALPLPGDLPDGTVVTIMRSEGVHDGE